MGQNLTYLHMLHERIMLDHMYERAWDGFNYNDDAFNLLLEKLSKFERIVRLCIDRRWLSI